MLCHLLEPWVTNMVGLLCIAALLGNVLALLLHPEGLYLPGSIAVLLACRRFGFGPGFLVAVVANSYILLFSTTPMVPLLWVAEALVVSMLFSRGLKNLFLADLLFWIFFGALLRYLIDVHWLEIPWPLAAPGIALQVLTAVLNSFFATLLYPLLRRSCRHHDGSLSFLEHELNLLAGCFLISPLLIILINFETPRDCLYPAVQSRLLAAGQRLEADLLRLNQEDFAVATENRPHLTQLLQQATAGSDLALHLLGPDHSILASNQHQLRLGNPYSDETHNALTHGLFYRYIPEKRQLRKWGAPGSERASEVPFLVFEIPLQGRQRHMQQMILLSMTAMLLPAIPVLLVRSRIKRHILTPLQNLAETAEHLPLRIRQGEPLRWPPSLYAECGSLKAIIQEAADALSSSYAQLERYRETSTEMLEEVLAQHRWESFTSNKKLKEERTRRQRVEQLIQNIEQAETQYRFLIEKTMVGVFIIQDNFFTYVNPRFAEIFGYTQQQIMEQLTLPDLIHPDDRFLVTANNLKQLNGSPGNNLQYEFRGLKQTGELIHVEVLNGQSSRDGQPAIIGTLLDVSKRREAEATVHHLAFHDPLTELPNRILFGDRVQQALRVAERNKEQVALLFIDLDRFKSVNDTLGHSAGDTILKEVSTRLTNCLRQSDTVSRFGGDEFNVLLTRINREDEVNLIAHKILKALEWPFQVEGREIFLSGSIGIALYPKDGQDAMTLTKNADTALYRAKDLGRNNYQPYSSGMNSKALERMALESSLRRVIEQQELRVYYQPQVDLQTGQIVGLEALMRWHHQTGRMIEPSVFIPLAEETGLIVPMGEWILRAACAQLQEWNMTGLPPLRLGVNVSSKQFQQINLTELVRSILQETGLPAAQLNLEITETMVMADVHESIDVLQRLRDVGVTIAIDDFGTGFSSLSYLKDFPADHLKIDRAFVQNLPFNKNEANIARHIIELAHSLGLKVIAEGVERQDQKDFLSALGCDEIQGFLIAPPLPAEELLAVLEQNRGGERSCHEGPGDPGGLVADPVQTSV